MDDELTSAGTPSAKQTQQWQRLATRSVGGSAVGTLTTTDMLSRSSGVETVVTTAMTPADAIRQAELARIRFFVPVVVVLALAVLALMQWLGGRPTARIVAGAGIVVSIVAVLFLYPFAPNPSRYTKRRLAAVYFVCVVGGSGAVYYFGIFSPAPAVAVLGMFFVGIGRSTRVSLFIFVTALVTHAGIVAIVVGRAIPDYGLITGAGLEQTKQLAIQGAFLGIMSVTYLLARATRRQSEKSLVDLDRAARDVAQREALLEEARQELDRVLEVGGPGRFSEQVIGSFRLGVLIGRGAMGEVYDAVDVETGRAAAVKLIHSAAVDNPDRLSRFLREAQVIASLSSPHVVQLLEVGGESGSFPYMAMERLYGHDLAYELRQRRELDVNEIVDIVGQVAAGLDVAHAAGIVHRDIKPNNLFLTVSASGNGRCKILDFGVSKLEGGDSMLTQGRIVGTPMYMAPEQALGEDVDHRVDCYALATVAYRMITGYPPFSGKDPASILYQVVHGAVRRPGMFTELPPDVDAVLAIGMAKRPSDRFDSALGFANMFAAAANSELDDSLRARAHTLVAEHPWNE